MPALHIGHEQRAHGEGLLCRAPVRYPAGLLSLIRFALPAERSSVSGGTAFTFAVTPIVFLMWIEMRSACAPRPVSSQCSGRDSA